MYYLSKVIVVPDFVHMVKNIYPSCILCINGWLSSSNLVQFITIYMIYYMKDVWAISDNINIIYSFESTNYVYGVTANV